MLFPAALTIRTPVRFGAIWRGLFTPRGSGGTHCTRGIAPNVHRPVDSSMRPETVSTMSAVEDLLRRRLSERSMLLVLPNTRLKLAAPSCCGGLLFVKSYR